MYLILNPASGGAWPKKSCLRLGVIFNALTISFHISAGTHGASGEKTGGVAELPVLCLNPSLSCTTTILSALTIIVPWVSRTLPSKTLILFDIVNTELIRFQMHRFVTVSKFSLAGWRMGQIPDAKQSGVFNFCRAHIRF